MKDADYIKRCFDLARLGAGKVSPNPMVGAVIVYDGKIIGEGFHEQIGGDHAEINAINSVKDKSLLNKSTIYVSLEPCCHYGRTPPCVDSLLRYKFPRVVVSLIDPNPKVMGRSIEKLEANGVEVSIRILEKEAVQRSAFFLAHFEKKRPYIILKYAKSLNNVFGVLNQQVWITNPYVQRLVHRWRSEVAAILVATNTALVDNPQLNNRFYFGNNPVRILLDRQLKVNSLTSLLKDDLPTIIVTETEKRPKPPSNACEYLHLPFDEHLLDKLMLELYQKGMDSIIVEGGADLLNSFIQKDLWDEARIFTGGTLIATEDAVFSPMIKGQLVRKIQIGNNNLEFIRNES